MLKKMQCGKEVITDRAVTNRFFKFRSADVTLKDELKGGVRPSDFDDDIFMLMLDQSPRETLRELVEKQLRYNHNKSSLK